MKEATGELNMTVIVVIAIAGIAGLAVAFIYPMMKQQIANNTCKAFGENYTAVKENTGNCIEADTSDDGTTEYYCCKN